jgi:DNA repair protein RadC
LLSFLRRQQIRNRGIKGINVQTLAKTIITKFNKDFLNITIDDLLTVKGIGQTSPLGWL